MTTNRRILLARRPQGQVQEEDLRFVEEPLAPLQDGHVRFRNRYISLDPATRGWMDDKASYMQPIPIDGVMLSAGVAEVIESKLDGWEKGDIVSALDRKSTRLNSSHVAISYAVFCLKKKRTQQIL